jgi:amino acid adenylation domain-containing protein
MPRHRHFLDIVREHSEIDPEAEVCRFVKNTTSMEGVSLNYAELDILAKKIAVKLLERLKPGDRVLVLHKPGIDYIASLFGCFYSGMIVVPVFSPNFGNVNASASRLIGIINDCSAGAILTSAESLPAVETFFSNHQRVNPVHCISSDDVTSVDVSIWRAPKTCIDDISLLQYTSGSTSAPKGVMVSQQNLIENVAIICDAFRMHQPGHLVIWLPPYHDMGLIGGILAPIFSKYPLTLMSPLSFIKDPLAWLRIISEKNATISGGPNFAYSLCAKALEFKPDIELDLSSWDIAFCGSEPVKPSTAEGFTDTFSRFGLKKSSFAVCYGLAETTLMVSTSLLSKEKQSKIGRFEDDALRENHQVLNELTSAESAKRIVSCGPVIPRHEVEIVEPQLCTRVAPGAVGEVWVSGKSVAKGYWGNPDQTQQTFFAELQDGEKKKSWLRTGDYGFLFKDELYITGRIKDLIIVRGQNYYPQDIESLSENLHDSLLFCHSAAFVLEEEGEDCVIFIQEVRGVTDQNTLTEIAGDIRQCVSQNLGLHLSKIVLVAPKSLPKTTSGKIQRSLARKRYLEKQLKVILLSESNDDIKFQTSAPIDIEKLLKKDIAKLVQTSLNDYLAARYGNNFLKLNKTSLIDLGLDSIRMIELKNHIEHLFTITLDINVVYENKDSTQLCDYIAEQVFIRQMQKHEPGGGGSGDDLEARVEYALDPGRQAIFYTCLFNPDSTVYHIARAVRLHEALNTDVLGQAVAILLKRNPNLSSVYSLEGEKVVRREANVVDSVLSVEPCEHMTRTSLTNYVKALSHKPFELEKGPLIKIHYLRAAERGATLLFKVHHIVSDFWCLSQMFMQLSEIYGALAQGKSVSVDSQVSAERFDPVEKYYYRYISSDQPARDRAFWLDYLKGIEFPVKQRASPPSVDSLTFEVEHEAVEKIANLAKRKNVTPYILLLTAYQLSLFDVLKKDCIVTGTPVTLRDNRALSDFMGYCSNLIPIVSRFSTSNDIQEIYSQVVDSVTSVFKHKNYFFSSIVEDLSIGRDRDYLPVFDTMFVYQSVGPDQEGQLGAFAVNAEEVELQVLGKRASTISVLNKHILSPLCFSLSTLGSRYQCCVEYDTGEYNQDNIKELSQRFKTYLALLEQGSTHMELPTAQREVREQVNSTKKLFPDQDLSLDQLFTLQATKTPESIAVMMGEDKLSYGGLNDLVDQWSKIISQRKIKANELIAIVMEKSIDQVVASLSIMAAGCAYLPIDADFSDEKITELFELGEIRCVLTQSQYQNKISGICSSYHTMDHIETIDQGPQLSVMLSPQLEMKEERSNTDLAYVIFTSGSTGKSKGVMIEHKQVVNTLLDINERFSVSAQDRMLGLSNLDFDLSVYDIFGVLAAGGTLVLCEKNKNKEPDYWQKIIQKHRITLWNSVPMFMQMLLEHEADADQGQHSLRDTLRVIMLSGDWIPLDLPKKVSLAFNGKSGLSSPVQLVAMGGATECSIWSNYYRVDYVEPHWKSIPYGKPLANQYYEIFDAGMQPCPDGVSGDLYIGGVGVARGYWKDSEKTQRQFVKHPASGECLYRTGDRALYWPDGNIEFLGREDDQVKIGGYRIELGDISNRLKSCDSVREALVILNKENEKTQLTAYFTLAEGVLISVDLISCVREQLNAQLPQYMWPEHFIVLEKFPLSRNGKVDRKALPRPETTHFSKEKKQASGELQERLTKLWQEVLSVDDIYVNDNFFELGGNSLLVVKLNNRISKMLNVRLEVNTLVNNQTIEALDDYIRNRYVHRDIEPIKRCERVVYKAIN